MQVLGTMFGMPALPILCPAVSSQSVLAVLLTLALTTLASAAPQAPVADPAPPRLSMQTFSFGPGYFKGQAYLIAQPAQQVRAALVAEAGAAFAGFEEKSIDMTAHTGGWESEWFRTWLTTHPQALSALGQANLKALDTAARDQLITASERSAWGALIAGQGIAATLKKNDDEVRRRANPPPRRAEWFRYTSRQTLLKPYDTAEFITVADVSTFLGSSTPVTLLWYAGSRTQRTAEGFKFFACISGVACVPAPHVDYSTDTAVFERPQVSQSLQRIAQRLGTAPATQMHALQAVWQAESSQTPALEAPPPSSPPSAMVALKLMPLTGLQAIGGGRAVDAMKALPDGRFVTLLGAQQNGGLLLQRVDDRIQASPLRGPDDIASTRIDYQGRLWTMSLQSVANEDYTRRGCVQRPELRGESQPAVSKSAPASYCFKNWKEFTWFMDPRDGPVLYTDSHPSFPQYPTRLITAQGGRTTLIGAMLEARRALVDRVPGATVSTPLGDLLSWGDGRAWFADLNLYAVSAASGKVEKSAALGGLQDMFFGSTAGNWVIALDSREAAPTIGVFEPSSGRIARRIGVTNLINLNAFARTAHGRLLAFANDRTVEVWDMRTGEGVATLALGEKERAISVAFDWQGRNLWVQAGGNGVAVWPVPPALQDGADAANIPDQVVRDIGQPWQH